jgi:hypothetical protein
MLPLRGSPSHHLARSPMDDLTISMFDRINLANCAVQRACAAAGMDGDRFSGEYRTARMWTKYRIHSGKLRFVEPD